MMDDETLAMLIYQHAQQLTLLDYPVWEAFDVAHRTAAAAFDQEFTSLGLEKARNALRKELHDRQAKTAAKGLPKPVGGKSGGDT